MGPTSRGGKTIAAILAALTAGLAAALWLASFVEGTAWLPLANSALAVYFVSAALCLLLAFRRQVRRDPYSYDTIFCAGFALFILSLAATHGYSAVLYFRNPGVYDDRQMLFSLLHSAKNYMFLTSPMLLVFSAALFLANLRLIRHEGRRFVNILGLLLAFLLAAGEICIGLMDYAVSVSGTPRILPNVLVNLSAAFYLYFECMMIGTIIANLCVLRRVPPPDRDYLIVLGCGIRKDGTPTPLLKGRLDLALKFDKMQRAESGHAAVFVVSGGQGPDEIRPEAHAMRDYLRENGIPADRILAEDRSSDTLENMRFSAELIRPLCPEPRTAFFTTNYHVFRAGIKAREAGLPAEGLGAATKWYFWPNAAVREFIGLLTEHRHRQILILLGMILAYTALTVLALSAGSVP